MNNGKKWWDVSDGNWDWQLKQFIVRKLAHTMTKSQKVISRWFKSYLLKTLSKKQLFTVDLYLKMQMQITDPVFVVGDFYKHTWKDFIQMRYSTVLSCYTTRVVVKNWAQFKFVMSDKYFWSSEYDSVILENGIQNNIFRINEQWDQHHDKNVSWEMSNLSCQISGDIQLSNDVWGNRITGEYTSSNKKYDRLLGKLEKINHSDLLVKSLSSKIVPRRKQFKHPCPKSYSNWDKFCKMGSLFNSIKTLPQMIKKNENWYKQVYWDNKTSLLKSKSCKSRKRGLKSWRYSQTWVGLIDQLDQPGHLKPKSPTKVWWNKPGISDKKSSPKLGERNFSHSVMHPAKYFDISVR